MRPYLSEGERKQPKANALPRNSNYDFIQSRQIKPKNMDIMTTFYYVPIKKLSKLREFFQGKNPSIIVPQQEKWMKRHHVFSGWVQLGEWIDNVTSIVENFTEEETTTLLGYQIYSYNAGIIYDGFQRIRDKEPPIFNTFSLIIDMNAAFSRIPPLPVHVDAFGRISTNNTDAPLAITLFQIQDCYADEFTLLDNDMKEKEVELFAPINTTWNLNVALSGMLVTAHKEEPDIPVRPTLVVYINHYSGTRAIPMEVIDLNAPNSVQSISSSQCNIILQPGLVVRIIEIAREETFQYVPFKQKAAPGENTFRMSDLTNSEEPQKIFQVVLDVVYVAIIGQNPKYLAFNNY